MADGRWPMADGRWPMADGGDCQSLVGSRMRPKRLRRYSRLVARTARRDVIGLLIEKQVTYTEVEADALITRAKKLAKESGRTVRAEAELLLSTDRRTRLRDLQNKVIEANKLLAAITVQVDDLRTESDEDDGELTTIMATMATSCEPFSSVRTEGSISTAKPGELPLS
jgi:hypothetical protein